MLGIRKYAGYSAKDRRFSLWWSTQGTTEHFSYWENIQVDLTYADMQVKKKNMKLNKIFIIFYFQIHASVHAVQV